MEKTIKIDSRFGKQFAGTYVFRSISWGTSNQISSDCTTLNPVTKISSIDLKKLQARMLYASLKEKPQIVTMDLLCSEDPEKGLPLALGEILMGMADLVNGFGPKERKELKKLKQRWGLE